MRMGHNPQRPGSWLGLQRLSLEPKVNVYDPAKFTTRVDLGSLKELSGGEAEEEVPPGVLPGEPQGTGSVSIS